MAFAEQSQLQELLSMTEMSLRKHFRSTLTTLSLGMAALCLHSPAQAQDCLPAFPGRSGNYIVCPDDMNFDREFAALIQFDTTVSPPVETLLEWGSYYYPFDGYRQYAPSSSGVAYAIRATCQDTTFTSDPTNSYVKGGKVGNIDVTCFPVGTKVMRPRPVSPVLVKKDQQTGTVILEVPDWTPPQQPVNLPEKVIYPKQGYAYRLSYARYEGTQWGKARILEVSGDPATKTVGDPHAIFNGKNVEVHNLDPKGNYYFVTEVLYDYGEEYKSCRFQSINSYPLEVNMSSSVTGHMRPFPVHLKR